MARETRIVKSISMAKAEAEADAEAAGDFSLLTVNP